MLQRIIGEQWFEARGVVGFWPANADGDDIVLYTDETPHDRARPPAHPAPADGQDARARANAGAGRLRRAGRRPRPTGSAASRSPPATARPRSPRRFKDAGDDYSAILAAALADRLAEAFAEALHRKVRTELWGYAPDEPFDIDALIAEQYRGIRPAPGYPGPARPHREGDPVPPAGRRGRHRHGAHRELRHDPAGGGLRPLLRPPGGHYFGVGKIERDQVEDYARRKGWDLATAERWLAPILNYEPGAARVAAA